MKNSKNSVVNAPIVNLMKDVVPTRQCARKGVEPQVSLHPYQPVVIDECTGLIMRIKFLLCSLNEANNDKKFKVITATEIYSLLNSEMMKHDKLYKSNKFVLTVFNKTFELEDSTNDKDMISGVDLKILENLRTEMIKIRPTLRSLIEKIEDNVILQNDLNRARANMNKIQRPRRNMQRVNYAGMDMTSEDIGELCVFKPWFENGKVIEKCSRRRLSQANELDDEDYVFEEDQDDKEEEEQDAKEKFCKKIWAKIHPESTAMPRRTRKQINYAGMDMNEDDIGEVSICKPWFKDGKVTYKWSKRNLSQVNELDDEDEAVIYKYGKKIYI
jgi:hypothetical protein